MSKSNNEELRTLLTNILHKNVDINSYTQFIQVIALKFQLHAASLHQILYTRIDISSAVSILRAQLETYTTLFYLFIKGCSNERMLRFNLWKLDGLKQRSMFSQSFEGLSSEEASKLSLQIKDEKKQIEELELEISSLKFFTDLPEKYQKQIVERAYWRFDIKKIELNKNRINYTIKEMVENSKIKPLYINDMYSFFSMHSHTSYISAIQNQQMTQEFFPTVQGQMDELSSILTTLVIKYYTKLFDLDINDFCGEKHVIFRYLQRIKN